MQLSMQLRIPIAILTDFGYGNPYTPQMVSIIKSISPRAEILFTFDGIEFANILQARFLLEHFLKFLPERCVVMCVVDPGVGTKRKILCSEIGGRIVLAPDNGILSVGKFREVKNKSLFARTVSATFHGRDIFAPVAARLAQGLAASKVGPRVSPNRAERLYEVIGGNATGRIVIIDAFGNCVTTIPTSIGVPSGAIARGTKIARVVRTYANSKSKAPFVIAGSFDTFEISCNRTSAAMLLGLRAGDPVKIRF